MANFSSKVILVTGASSGIGAGIALAFSKQGACLCITGRNDKQLSQVAQNCEEAGAKEILQVVADLKTTTDIEKVVKDVISKYRKLDVLVNNAGVLFPGGALNTNLEDFDSTFAVNVRAPFYFTQLCIPHLEKTQGNIVNMSSIDSTMHFFTTIAYGMTKAAIDHLTKTTALELAKKGIRVNAINPGLCQTSIYRHQFPDPDECAKEFEHDALNHPLGKRNVEISEIADAVLFLASDNASAITGTCLKVDGGRHLTGK